VGMGIHLPQFINTQIMNSKKGDMLHTYIQFNEATTLVDDSKKVIDKL